MGAGRAGWRGLGWGVALGAALAGLQAVSTVEALQAALLALALTGLVGVLRWLGSAGCAALAADRPAERVGLMPAWPPPAFGQAYPPGPVSGRGVWWPWRQRILLATASPWKALTPPVGTVRRRWAAGLGWGLVVGSVLGGQTLERRLAALEALDLPRLAWVGGYAGGPWAAGTWSARLRLVAPRLDPHRCPLPQEGVALPGAVEVEAPLRVARLRPITAGRWVCVRGLLRIPDEAPVPGAFSPRRYLNARGVLSYVRVRAAQRVVLVALPEARPPLWLRLRAGAMDGARAAARRVTAVAGERAGAWFRAVALGEDEALAAEQKAALQASGLGHLTSVSGMHIGLLAGPLLLACRHLRGRAWRWAAASTAGLGGWLYAAATGMESPAVRALLVQGSALAAGLAGRRPGLWGRWVGRRPDSCCTIPTWRAMWAFSFPTRRRPVSRRWRRAWQQARACQCRCRSGGARGQHPMGLACQAPGIGRRRRPGERVPGPFPGRPGGRVLWPSPGPSRQPVLWPSLPGLQRPGQPVRWPSLPEPGRPRPRWPVTTSDGFRRGAWGSAPCRGFRR